MKHLELLGHRRPPLVRRQTPARHSPVLHQRLRLPKTVELRPAAQQSAPEIHSSTTVPPRRSDPRRQSRVSPRCSRWHEARATKVLSPHTACSRLFMADRCAKPRKLLAQWKPEVMNPKRYLLLSCSTRCVASVAARFYKTSRPLDCAERRISGSGHVRLVSQQHDRQNTRSTPLLRQNSNCSCAGRNLASSTVHAARAYAVH